MKEQTDRIALEKPFSMDELLKRFSLAKVNILPFTPPRNSASDFSIVIGDDVATAFALDAVPPDPNAEDFSFSEPFPPQPRPENGR